MSTVRTKTNSPMHHTDRPQRSLEAHRCLSTAPVRSHPHPCVHARNLPNDLPARQHHPRRSCSFPSPLCFTFHMHLLAEDGSRAHPETVTRRHKTHRLCTLMYMSGDSRRLAYCPRVGQRAGMGWRLASAYVIRGARRRTDWCLSFALPCETHSSG